MIVFFRMVLRTALEVFRREQHSQLCHIIDELQIELKSQDQVKLYFFKFKNKFKVIEQLQVENGKLRAKYRSLLSKIKKIFKK